MFNMNYLEQLKHPNWQRKRLEIMQRDNYQCQSCGNKEVQLNVHHGYYDKYLYLWEYNNETLHTLCFPCHSETHSVLYVLKESIGKLNTRCIYDLIDLLELVNNQELPSSFILRQLVAEFKDIYDEQVCKYPF